MGKANKGEGEREVAGRFYVQRFFLYGRQKVSQAPNTAIPPPSTTEKSSSGNERELYNLRIYSNVSSVDNTGVTQDLFRCFYLNICFVFNDTTFNTLFHVVSNQFGSNMIVFHAFRCEYKDR